MNWAFCTPALLKISNWPRWSLGVAAVMPVATVVAPRMSLKVTATLLLLFVLQVTLIPFPAWTVFAGMV
jgi:hypothetical protein